MFLFFGMSECLYMFLYSCMYILATVLPFCQIRPFVLCLFLVAWLFTLRAVQFASPTLMGIGECHGFHSIVVPAKIF